jgi:hypothetical protein
MPYPPKQSIYSIPLTQVNVEPLSAHSTEKREKISFSNIYRINLPAT